MTTISRDGRTMTTTKMMMMMTITTVDVVDCRLATVLATVPNRPSRP